MAGPLERGSTVSSKNLCLTQRHIESREQVTRGCKIAVYRGEGGEAEMFKEKETSLYGQRE